MAASQAAIADPASNAVVSPEVSYFTRVLLKAALKNSADLSPAWVAQAQALLANVLMNDYLNWWNDADLDKSTLSDAQNAIDEAMKLNPPDPVRALACHVQGLIERATGKPNPARKTFRQAKELDSGFARAHAQFGNQKAALGRPEEVQDPLDKAMELSPRHPASGYFYWGKGRGYLERQDWGDAIYWLKKSVEVLPTVWYNRCYLATAQHNSPDQGDRAAALKTVEDFINKFDQDTFERIKKLTPDPNYPARKIMLDFVQQLLP